MHSAYLVLDTYRFMLGCIQSDYGILLTAQSNASTVSTEKADWKHDLAAIKLDVHQKQSTPWCFFFDLSSRKKANAFRGLSAVAALLVVQIVAF